MKIARKHIACLVLMISSQSCTSLFFEDDPANSPVEAFEYFWKGVDEVWPEFATKNVNWDSLYAVYRPQVNPGTTGLQLSMIFQQLVNSLGDSHTDVFPISLPAVSYKKALLPQNFYGVDWIRSKYLLRPESNSVITFGKIGAEIGYIHIRGFSGPSAPFEAIDEILNEFKDLKGIIIDVRSNGGGTSTNSHTIASRFFGQRTTYAYNRYRTGPEREVMSDFVPVEIDPQASNPFSGKIAVLTNRLVFSSAEDFVLAMRASGKVIIFGDRTRGGSGTHPIMRELPNGWAFRMSTLLRCDLSKQPIANGIAPDFLVSTLKSDSIQGKDTIIEAALAELLK